MRSLHCLTVTFTLIPFASLASPCMPDTFLDTPACAVSTLSPEETVRVYEQLEKLKCTYVSWVAEEYADVPVYDFLLCTLQSEEEPWEARLAAAKWLGELDKTVVIQLLVDLLKQPWPELQDKTTYESVIKMLSILGALEGAEAFDALYPFTGSSIWEGIIGVQGVERNNASKEQLIWSMRDSAYQALATTGDPRAIAIFSRPQTEDEAFIWDYFWNAYLEMAQQAAAGEIVVMEGKELVVRKKAEVMQERKERIERHIDITKLLPAPPYRPHEEPVNLDEFIEPPQNLELRVGQDLAWLFDRVALGHGAEGETALDTCRALAADTTLPEDLRRYAYLRQITHLTYAGREGEAVAVGTRWMSQHPDDPEGWKIDVIMASVVCTRGDPLFDDFAYVKRYCDRLLRLREPKWAVYRAHMLADYRFQHVRGAPDASAARAERSAHLHRAQQILLERLAAPDKEDGEDEYLLKKLEEDLNPRIEALERYSGSPR